MNKFVIAGIIINVFLLYSCSSAVTFDKPQPDNIQPLDSFPERLQGKYLSNDKASILTITGALLARNYNFDYKVYKDSIDPSYKLVGDTIIDLENGTKEKIFIKGDTVFQHANRTDTLFNLSQDNILKKFKGYYFLNILYRDSSWEVKKLSLKNGVLTVGNISYKDDIQKLQELTDTKSDTISTPFILTKKQFKKFVRQNGFSEEEKFIRIAEKFR